MRDLGIPAGRNPYKDPVRFCKKCQRDTIRWPSLYAPYHRFCSKCGAR